MSVASSTNSPRPVRQRVGTHPRDLVLRQRRRGAYDAQRGPTEPDRGLLDERHEPGELALEVEGRQAEQPAEHLGDAEQGAGVGDAEVVDVGLRRQLGRGEARPDLDDADAHGLQDRDRSDGLRTASTLNV